MTFGHAERHILRSSNSLAAFDVPIRIPEMFADQAFTNVLIPQRLGTGTASRDQCREKGHTAFSHDR
jgi:hypothetical protein